jgi:hypothetical protein
MSKPEVLTLDPHEVNLASGASCGEIAGLIDVRVRVGVCMYCRSVHTERVQEY